MTVTFRDPPSGPLIELVSSTDDVENDSVVPGSSASLALDSLETRLRRVEEYEILETFQGGVNGNTSPANVIGNVGDFSWSFIAGAGLLRSLSRGNGAGNRIGRYSVSGGTSSIGGVMLGSSGTPAPGIGLLPEQVVSVEWAGTCDASSGLNGKYRYGLGTSTAVTNMGANGIYFEGDELISFNWRCVVRKGGVNSVFSSTVPWTPNGTYFKLGIFRLSDGRFRFDINDVEITTFDASAIPTTRLVPACQVEATVNSGQAIEIDTCRFRYTRT